MSDKTSFVVVHSIMSRLDRTRKASESLRLRDQRPTAPPERATRRTLSHGRHHQPPTGEQVVRIIVRLEHREVCQPGALPVRRIHRISLESGRITTNRQRHCGVIGSGPSIVFTVSQPHSWGSDDARRFHSGSDEIRRPGKCLGANDIAHPEHKCHQIGIVVLTQKRRQRPVVAALRLWELGNDPGCVPGQRRDTPGNGKWSGRWESNISPAHPLSFQIMALQARIDAACDFGVKIVAMAHIAAFFALYQKSRCRP